MQLHKVAISLDDGAIALAHTMLKIGIWVRTLYQFFTVSGKIFPQKKCPLMFLIFGIVSVNIILYL